MGDTKSLGENRNAGSTSKKMFVLGNSDQEHVRRKSGRKNVGRRVWLPLLLRYNKLGNMPDV